MKDNFTTLSDNASLNKGLSQSQEEPKDSNPVTAEKVSDLLKRLSVNGNSISVVDAARAIGACVGDTRRYWKAKMIEEVELAMHKANRMTHMCGREDPTCGEIDEYITRLKERLNG